MLLFALGRPGLEVGGNSDINVKIKYCVYLSWRRSTVKPSLAVEHSTSNAHDPIRGPV